MNISISHDMHMKITSDCVIDCHSTLGSTKSFATPTVICKTYLSSSSCVLIKEIIASHCDVSRCHLLFHSVYPHHKAKASDFPADSVRFKQGQQIADSVLQLSAIKFSNQLAAS